MAGYELNQQGVANARRLIDDGNVDASTDWFEGQPSPDEENHYVEQHGHEAFGTWHLAVNPDASPETKSRYGVPFGDFSRLRDGLTSAKQRAAQYGHTEIAEVADELLHRVSHADDR